MHPLPAAPTILLLYVIASSCSRVVACKRGEGWSGAMEKNWKVSHVELLEGGTHFGFVLYDQKGRPCVSFGYADDKKAFAGRDLVAAALREVEQVLGRSATDIIELQKEETPRRPNAGSLHNQPSRRDRAHP